MSKFSAIGGFVRRLLAILAALIMLPLGAHALYHMQKDLPGSYWQADWSSTGLLPKAASHAPAMVRIYAARTGRWKGIFAVHSWIVVKEKNAANYERFEKVGWGRPLRVNAYAPDARWYSNAIDTIFAADGPEAEKLLPAIRAAVRAYKFDKYGDYRIWPGPNSNTFTSCVIASVPGIKAILPPTAIGKDYPCDGRWLAITSSRTGFRFSLAGLLGLNIGWVEGFEANILGAVIGIDARKPAIKLPGIGRIGV